MDDADMPLEITLKPGEMYVHAIRPDLWSACRENPKGEPDLPNLFVTPGRYTVACRFAPIPVVGEAGWEAGMISNSATLTVTKAEPKTGAWGEAVNGLRARVRLPDEPANQLGEVILRVPLRFRSSKHSIRAGGPLEFDFDLKNDGDRPRELEAYGVLCDVDIDGVRYGYLEKYDLKGNPRTIKPGE